ncbi:PREDICTED: peptidyl-prolyl cis-trans isomerase CYP57 isoform X1 [Lupinus angustifolius]|uniref:peptidyl-prolyl cis-trans isomerase CYP57 isoform X1 n=1 Tax=Lupinus angustifolius TaxID=3871 RepID=UPI00092F30BC|nr:PREDICTED: peptidyl-prolyl cis-trans isomerase CYP57 isoform X1 [Lupinus angustifolius]
MSTVYVLEPPTKGKVVLKTTRGPIDIELWPKEAPKAVRNFIQLCVDGYYDNSIFHRIIKDFLIQAGDPTSTGTGGESIYGGVFSDEFHSRLKFKHRGIVAMANAGSPNSNGSQFFITLDRCDWLDRKHTIFGKVTGDTMYNLLRVGEVETDKNDRPLDPAPKILSVEVLWNPFEDIVPRTLQKPETKATSDTDNKDSKKKGIKKLNLLSFGEEAEVEEKELALVKQKIKSSHDVLNDPRLLREETANNESSSSASKLTRNMQLSVRDALNSKKEESQKDSEGGNFARLDSGDDEDEEADFDSRMRLQILQKRKELGDLPPKSKSQNAGRSNLKDHDMSAARSNASVDEDQPRVDRLSLRKKGIGSEARAERMANADVDMQLLSEAEKGRQLQKQKKRRLQGREDEVLAKLEKFKNALSAKTTSTTGESGDGKEEELSDWKVVDLKFAPQDGKDHMSRKEDPNDYVVHDPLLEKGKEKFNKMQAKQKRREREWAGRSLT